MKLLVFGLGYTAEAFVRRMAPRCAGIVGTKRAIRMGVAAPTPPLKQADGPPPRSNATRSLGPPDQGEGKGVVKVNLRVFPGEEAALATDIADADAILVSIPPDAGALEAQDPVLARFTEAILTASRLRWLGYLSTIGVYGDHDGAWIDETTPAVPTSPRSRARLATEGAWLALVPDVPVHVFRIAGIYGPRRSAFDKLEAGTAKRVVKPGQVFNRIHVEDIAGILEASLDHPRPGAIYNLADNEPAPPQDVIVEAARLAQLPLPPEILFSEAQMPPMAASFWGETKRVSNRLVREELGVRLAYPTYREGLRAILDDAAPEGFSGSYKEHSTL